MNEVNWAHVRRVIINHGAWWSRPTRTVLDDIGRWVPDAKILGFGRYTDAFVFAPLGKWYLTVESVSLFPDPGPQAPGNVLSSQLAAAHNERVRKLQLVHYE